MDQTLVTSLKPFFNTETTKAEFQTQFNKKLISKLLATFNSTLAKGVKLPLGTKSVPILKNTKVEIRDDCILIDGQIDTSS